MKLKPCPFCGVEPVFEPIGTTDRWLVNHDNKCWFSEPEYIMRNGLSHWNRRKGFKVSREKMNK